jgi:hypothetical protein
MIMLNRQGPNEIHLLSCVQALLSVPNCIKIRWVILETQYARDNHEIVLCVHYMRFVQTGNDIHKYNTINYFWPSATVRNIKLVPCYIGSRDSVVGIATGYGVDERGVGVRVPVGSRIFSSPRSPDRLWGPPSLLSNGYRGLFPRGLSSRGVKLTTHLQLVPRSRKCGSIHRLSHTPSWRKA